MESFIGLSLQIATIITTVLLGLITFYQTKKIQEGQNIISITTNYRQKRSDQLKDLVHTIIAYSSPELLEISNQSALDSFTNICDATSYLTTILHRCFEQDLELINLGETIKTVSFEYMDALYHSNVQDEIRISMLKKRLCAYRKVFTIKCDIYTYAEWVRIKKETNGINTSSKEWIKFYKDLQSKYEAELVQTILEYSDVLIEYKL